MLNTEGLEEYLAERLGVKVLSETEHYREFLQEARDESVESKVEVVQLLRDIRSLSRGEDKKNYVLTGISYGVDEEEIIQGLAEFFEPRYELDTRRYGDVLVQKNGDDEISLYVIIEPPEAFVTVSRL